ncbi:uncharacterized protein [Haliotis asinina]|uniref:uncharacterized protein n=1 Tax=Haliotis asinina TaxID=109174 RepID=UPI00353229D4
MKLYAVGVFVFGISIIGCGGQFKSPNLAASLEEAIRSGNVPMNSIGTNGVAAIDENLGSSGTSSEQQTTATEGNRPVSVKVGSRIKNILSFTTTTRKLVRKLVTLNTRMANLETYFNASGVFSPAEKTAEGTTTVPLPQFGGRPNVEISRNDERGEAVEKEIIQITERIEELKKAIADYKIANPAIAVTAAPEAAYTEGTETEFSDRRFSGYFTDDDLYDISGIALSLSFDDLLYAANDKSSSSNLNDFYVVNVTTGEVLNTIEVTGATNHDWEDMAVAPCSSAGSKPYCIYIGDIGEGKDGRTANNIYKIAEPDDPLTVKSVDPQEIISFTGVSDDMETLMVSPENDIYVIPEGDDEVKLYKIEEGKANYKCEVTVESKYSGPTSGDISSCGTMILLKANEYVYLFSVSNGDYEAALCNPTPTVHRLQYTQERENQAIAFNKGGLAYYTVQEEEFSPIWRYDRLREDEV